MGNFIQMCVTFDILHVVENYPKLLVNELIVTSTVLSFNGKFFMKWYNSRGGDYTIFRSSEMSKYFHNMSA